MIKKEFIPYQEASELKALSFDQKCIKMSEHRKTCVEKEKPLGCQLHNLHCGYPNCTIDKSITPVPLPTYSQAFRWFREKYGIFNPQRLIFETLGGKYGLQSHDEHDQVDGYFDTYEEAELACLRKLISIVKEQTTTSHTEPETTGKELLESADKTITVERQETLEEAAERYDTLDLNADLHFIAGAKWQQERSYSKEEVIDLLHVMNNWPTTFEGRIDIEEWFEQHKKK